MVTMTTLTDEEKKKIVSVKLSPGDAVLHNDFTLHYSDGNTTDGWRRSYLLAFRAEDVVKQTKALGLTRSRNPIDKISHPQSNEVVQ